jgi:hypothetical protein
MGSINQHQHTALAGHYLFLLFYYYITPVNPLTADLAVLSLILLVVLLLHLPLPNPAQVDTLMSAVHHILRVEILNTAGG